MVVCVEEGLEGGNTIMVSRNSYMQKGMRAFVCVAHNHPVQMRYERLERNAHTQVNAFVCVFSGGFSDQESNITRTIMGYYCSSVKR